MTAQWRGFPNLKAENDPRRFDMPFKSFMTKNALNIILKKFNKIDVTYSCKCCLACENANFYFCLDAWLVGWLVWF